MSRSQSIPSPHSSDMLNCFIQTASD